MRKSSPFFALAFTTPGLELQTHALDLAPLVDGGIGVVHVAIDARRPGEDLAIGEVLAPGAVDPDALGHIDAQVGAFIPIPRGHTEAEQFLPLQVLADALLPIVHLLPRGDRVGQVQQAGAEDELLVLPERHLGVLGRAIGGVGGAAPAQAAGLALLGAGGTLHEHLEPRLAR